MQALKMEPVLAVAAVTAIIITKPVTEELYRLAADWLLQTLKKLPA